MRDYFVLFNCISLIKNSAVQKVKCQVKGTFFIAWRLKLIVPVPTHQTSEKL